MSCMEVLVCWKKGEGERGNQGELNGGTHYAGRRRGKGRKGRNSGELNGGIHTLEEEGRGRKEKIRGAELMYSYS